MRLNRWTTARAARALGSSFALACATAALAAVAVTWSSPVAAETAAKMDATIFSYDGHDFVRTQTTLVTDAGKPATGTKLERDSAAYKALAAKHSWSGEVTLFGRKYDAHYAPVMGEDGRLTGALFVAVAK